MAATYPSLAFPFLPRVDVDRGARLRGLVLCLIAMVAVAQSCSPTLPGSPGMGLSTISGHVYRQETPALGEPMLVDAIDHRQGR